MAVTSLYSPSRLRLQRGRLRRHRDPVQSRATTPLPLLTTRGTIGWRRGVVVSGVRR